MAGTAARLPKKRGRVSESPLAAPARENRRAAQSENAAKSASPLVFPRQDAAAPPREQITPSPAAKKSLQKLFEQRFERNFKALEWRNHLLPKAVFVVVLLAGLSSRLWSSREEPLKQLPEVVASGKIADLEDAMRKTDKWIQVQLEAVGNQIGKALDGARSDMEYRIAANSKDFQEKLKKLKLQVDSVDSSVKTVYSNCLLSKQETVEFIRSAVEKKAEEAGQQSLNLDDVRVAARKQVQQELKLHLADGIGRRDYALESGGGSVVYHSEGYFQGVPWTKTALHVIPGVFRRHPFANKVLKPSFGEPGQCLPLKGSNVFVDIRLRGHILPTAVTLEHLSKKVAYDIRSAPKGFRLYGWNEIGKGLDTDTNFLGEFTYHPENGSTQTFDLPKSGQPERVNMIRLHVVSNHGSPLHTCLYRLRVHGSE